MQMRVGGDRTCHSATSLWILKMFPIMKIMRNMNE